MHVLGLEFDRLRHGCSACLGIAREHDDVQPAALLSDSHQLLRHLPLRRDSTTSGACGFNVSVKLNNTGSRLNREHGENLTLLALTSAKHSSAPLSHNSSAKSGLPNLVRLPSNVPSTPRPATNL